MPFSEADLMYLESVVPVYDIGHIESAYDLQNMEWECQLNLDIFDYTQVQGEVAGKSTPLAKTDFWNLKNLKYLPFLHQ